MSNQFLLKLGDRIIDLNAVTHATYITENVAEKECVLSFSNLDNFQIFYSNEADATWKLLSLRAIDPTGVKGNNGPDDRGI